MKCQYLGVTSSHCFYMVRPLRNTKEPDICFHSNLMGYDEVDNIYFIFKPIGISFFVHNQKKEIVSMILYNIPFHLKRNVNLFL